MIWIVLLTVVTYSRSLINRFISDDITINAKLRNTGYPVDLKRLENSWATVLTDLFWKYIGERPFLQHLLNLFLFTCLTTSLYIVLCKYIPERVAFLATMIFTVHPCNAQVGGWISGKWYGVSLLVGLWALYFNNILLAIFTPLIACNLIPLPLLMDIPWYMKVMGIGFGLLILWKNLSGKYDNTSSEIKYKTDNLKIYPKKLVVALKSFSYYFSLAFMPTRMGWFHTLGEPIDEKTKSMDFHFALGLLLVLTMCGFLGRPAFSGFLIFGLFIAPFSNIVTPALFTSERYMAPALVGWSIALAYITVDYPIIATVFIVVYFMRTQLELWAYKDDFHLALYSLLNFENSGFAWSNISNYFLISRRPSAAYDTLKEAIKLRPDFPTPYYQLHLMYRATDLLADYDLALDYLEKAVTRGKHESWHKDLEGFKKALLNERVGKFKENVRIYTAAPRYTARPQPTAQADRQLLLGANTNNSN